MDFVLHLDDKAAQPLYQRLANAIKQAIWSGRLVPGQEVPSVRDISASLQISRSTVLRAFEELQSQGFLTATSGSRTYVKRELPDRSGTTAQTETPRKTARNFALTPYGTRVLNAQCTSVHVEEVNFGGPPPECVPLTHWKRLLLKHSRDCDYESIAELVEPLGYAPLRDAVAAYLHRSRAVNYDPECVVLFGSKQLRLDLIARLFLNAGDHVAFEEPGFPEAREVFLCHGAQIVPVAVRDDGLDIDELEQSRSPIKLVYITPSHHDPRGVTLSLDKRKRLLRWAEQCNAYIIEDDFDSEYRYGEKALPSIQALDQSGRVIFLSSPWRILFQVLRFGYVVFPPSFMPLVTQAKMNLERHIPAIEQFAFADFINEGLLELQIKRNSSLFARRRQALVLALTRHMRDTATITSASAGMHLLVQLECRQPDDQIAALAKAASVPAFSTAAYYFAQPVQGEFIITFVHMDESQTDARIKRWSELLRQGASE